MATTPQHTTEKVKYTKDIKNLLEWWSVKDRQRTLNNTNAINPLLFVPNSEDLLDIIVSSGAGTANSGYKTSNKILKQLSNSLIDGSNTKVDTPNGSVTIPRCNIAPTSMVTYYNYIVSANQNDAELLDNTQHFNFSAHMNIWHLILTQGAQDFTLGHPDLDSKGKRQSLSYREFIRTVAEMNPDKLFENTQGADSTPLQRMFGKDRVHTQRWMTRSGATVSKGSASQVTYDIQKSKLSHRHWVMAACKRNYGGLDELVNYKGKGGGGNSTTFKFASAFEWLYKSVQSLKPNGTDFGNSLKTVFCRHHRYDIDDYAGINNTALASWQGIQYKNLWGNARFNGSMWTTYGSPKTTHPLGQTNPNKKHVFVPYTTFKDGNYKFDGDWDLAFWNKQPYYRNNFTYESYGEYIKDADAMGESKDIALSKVGSVYAMNPNSNYQGLKKQINWTSSTVDGKRYTSMFVGEDVNKPDSGWLIRFIALSNEQGKIYHPMWHGNTTDKSWQEDFFPEDLPSNQAAGMDVETRPAVIAAYAKVNQLANFPSILKWFNNDYAGKGKIDNLWWMMNKTYDNSKDKGLEEDYLDFFGKQDRDWTKKHQTKVEDKLVNGLANTWCQYLRVNKFNSVVNRGLADGGSLAPIFGYLAVNDDPERVTTEEARYPIYTLYLYCWLMNALMVIHEKNPGSFPALKLMLEGSITLPEWVYTFDNDGVVHPSSFKDTQITYESVGLTNAFNSNAMTNTELAQQTQLQSFKNFLNLFDWLFEPASKAAKVLQEIRKENTSVDAKSSRVSQSNAQSKQFLVLNSQCYMLNMIDKFAAKHPDFSHGLFEYKSYSTINGNCNNLPNILYYNKEVTPQLLTAKPLTIASLQPRIQLFKRRPHFSVLDRESTATSVESAPRYPAQGKSLKVFAPFDTHQDFNNFNMAGNTGRRRGCGIKNISVNQEHGNQAFAVAEHTKIEITFHFNRLDEIFINWPVTDVDGGVSYPFGYDGNAGEYASVAELVFPLAQSRGGLATPADTVGFDTVKRGEFAIVLQFGWSVNEQLLKGITDPVIKKKLQKIEQNKGSLTKEFVLTPVSSDFSIGEDGTIELKIDYYGILEEKTRSPANRMFPETAQLQGSDRERNEQIGEIKRELRRLEGRNTLAIKNRRTLLRERLKTLNEQSLIAVRENFLTKQLSTFIDDLLRNNAYHRVKVPAALVGARNDGRVTKWSPYSELDLYREFEIQKDLVANAKTNWVFYHKGDKTLSKGHIFKDLKEAIKKSVSSIQAAKRVSRSGGPKKGQATAATHLKNATAAFTDMAKSIQTGKASKTVNIDFIYLGDIIEIFLRRAYASEFHKAWDFAGLIKNEKDDPGFPENYKFFLRDDWYKLHPTAATYHLNDLIQQRVMFVLGTLDIPLLINNRKQPVRINIASLPIHAQIFIDFVVDEVIRPERYDISYVEFVTNFYSFVLRNYFTQVCFDSNTGISSIQPQINFFDLLSGTKGTPGNAAKYAAEKLIPIGQNEGKSFSRSAFETMFEKYQKKKTDNTNKQVPLSYCYLGGTSVDIGTFNYSQDQAKGIHHFYIGGDSGLVKKIEFKSKEIKGRAEALYFSAGNSADTAMFMIPRIYDVEVTMVGNNLFESGQTFFVDPTMGTLLYTGNAKNTTGINLIKNTGLGGYFYISKVETNISAGEYETILHGIKVGLAMENADSSRESQKIADLVANHETLNSNSMAALENIGAENLPPTDTSSKLKQLLKDLTK